MCRLEQDKSYKENQEMTSRNGTENRIKSWQAKIVGFLFCLAASFTMVLVFFLGVMHERTRQSQGYKCQLTKRVCQTTEKMEKSLQNSTPPNQLIELAIDQAKAGEISGFLARITDAKGEKDQGGPLKSAVKQIMGIILTDPEVEKLMKEVYWREILQGKTADDAIKEMFEDFDVMMLILEKVRASDLPAEISEDQVHKLAALTRTWLADNYSRFLTARP